MKKTFLFLVGLIGVLLMVSNSVSAQGTTTAFITGVVSGQDGSPLVGATVIAVHTPTGTKYGVITRDGGNFNLPNVRVGGPYTITASYIGFEPSKQEGIYLSLGEKRRFNLTLAGAGFTMDEVVISTTVGALGTERTGAETNIGEVQINSMPTVSRDLTDFTRLTPQATLTEDGDGELGFSVAGQNNRFNSVFIDGAISNDVFGLTDQGTNGGQAGISPISVDAIEQFNIVVAPYDVTIGGFSGAGVNAVTRSGSNEVDASVYYLFRNQGVSGKTPTDDENEERVQLADFNSWTGGFRVGGPIIKDKAFFFVNAEIERRNTPQPFNIDNYIGASSAADIDNLANVLRNTYNYEPGTYRDNPRTVDAEKFLAKIDWNLNEDHKLSIRHSYSRGRAEKTGPSDRDDINFSNIYEFFPTTTNSTAFELNSVFSASTANKLIIGYTSVRDDRDPLGDPFPRVRIADGSGEINFGSEEFSTANNLEQDILTLTDNFNVYSGNHSFTFGTHNELYSIFNLFVRQNFGAYNYDSLEDFLTGANPAQYARSYPLNPDGSVHSGIGDEITSGAADFGALQLGFYAQDEWRVNEDFTLTAGVRVDIPMFLDQPPVDETFNSQAISQIEAFYDIKGARAGQMPSTQLMLSPRVGFNYDLNGKGETVIRGGLGLFTSRLPFVWVGGSFTNNGISVGGVFEEDPDIDFRADPANQYTAADFGESENVPSGQVDLFEEDLKYPQVFRVSGAVDQKLPWDMVGSFEVMYTKTINSINYLNVNLKPSTQTLDGADNRPYFVDNDEIVQINGSGPYSRLIFGENTNEGYTFNVTASVQKPFENGLTFGVAYNYGYAEALNDLTSSQNSSQWRNIEVGPYGKNSLQVSRSDFSMGHRVVVNGSYRLDLNDNVGATFSLFYNGQSGEVFSYTYTGSAADRLTNQDSRDFTDLIYVPANSGEIEFVGTPEEQAAQWTALDAFISQDNYLKDRRGDYAERNGARTPATHIVDMRVLVDFSLMAGGKKHQFQLSGDMFNFTNFLNKNWGRRYRSNVNGVGLIDFIGFEDRGAGDRQPTFSFNESAVTNPEGVIDTKSGLTVDDIGLLSSRWQGQIGLRYLFN